MHTAITVWVKPHTVNCRDTQKVTWLVNGLATFTLGQNSQDVLLVCRKHFCHVSPTQSHTK